MEMDKFIGRAEGAGGKEILWVERTGEEEIALGGALEDGGGMPVKWATVDLLEDNTMMPVVRTMVSDEEGKWEFRGLEYRDWQVRVTVGGDILWLQYRRG